MKIITTKQFSRDYYQLSDSLKSKTKKQINFLEKNRFHPSLHSEKLEPKSENIFSFRINKKFRVSFLIEENCIFLICITNHYQ